MSKTKEKKYTHIGRQIRTYRIINGYTQQALADKLKITRANLAKIETGASNGSIEILLRISDLFGISLESLLGINDKQRIYIEIPSDLRDDFALFCKRINLSPNILFNMFAETVVKEQRLPFNFDDCK